MSYRRLSGQRAGDVEFESASWAAIFQDLADFIEQHTEDDDIPLYGEPLISGINLELILDDHDGFSKKRAIVTFSEREAVGFSPQPADKDYVKMLERILTTRIAADRGDS